VDPISIIAGFGAVFSAWAGVEKLYSVVVEGEPIINTNRYHSSVPPQSMNRVYTVHGRKYNCIRYKGEKFCR